MLWCKLVNHAQVTILNVRERTAIQVSRFVAHTKVSLSDGRTNLVQKVVLHSTFQVKVCGIGTEEELGIIKIKCLSKRLDAHIIDEVKMLQCSMVRLSRQLEGQGRSRGGMAREQTALNRYESNHSDRMSFRQEHINAIFNVGGQHNSANHQGDHLEPPAGDWGPLVTCSQLMLLAVKLSVVVRVSALGPPPEGDRAAAADPYRRLSRDRWRGSHCTSEFDLCLSYYLYFLKQRPPCCSNLQPRLLHEFNCICHFILKFIFNSSWANSLEVITLIPFHIIIQE